MRAGTRCKGILLGTDVTGTARLNNDNNGVLIDGAAGNTIGGTNAAARNIISGNDRVGVLIQDSDAATIVNSGAIGNVIQGNYIGLDITGNVLLGNGDEGIVDEGVNTIIGGIAATPGTAPGNVIVGASGEAVIYSRFSAGVLIQGNLLGTNASGTAGFHETGGIFLLEATGVIIGGTMPGAGNVISDASNDGIEVADSPGTVIQGNFIGTDITGTVAIHNGGNTRDAAVLILNSSDVLIGGTDAGAGNLISGNSGTAILIQTSTGQSVQGNLIGTQIDGVSPLGNASHGVSVSIFSGESNNTIGGTQARAANVIAFNGGNGVVAVGFHTPDTGDTGYSILGNSIFQNGALGIDLVAELNVFFSTGDGVTPNDVGDPDIGGNNLQNFPVLTSATTNADTTVEGTLNSIADTTFRVEFFSNSAVDPSGFGEGQTFLGFADVTTDASGDASISATLPVAVPGGEFITATATLTDPQSGELTDTSEVSQAIEVVSGECSFEVTTTNDVLDANDGVNSLREAIDCANITPGLDTISFNIPADDPGHVYYRDDGVAGQVTQANMATTTAADDSTIGDIDPDSAHSWFSIQSQSALPTITDAVTLDGYTQGTSTPGITTDDASPNTNPEGQGLNTILRIVLDGGRTQNPDGLIITAGSSTVRRLAFIHFDDAIDLRGSEGSIVEGGLIGTDASGMFLGSEHDKASSSEWLRQQPDRKGNDARGAQPHLLQRHRAFILIMAQQGT